MGINSITCEGHNANTKESGFGKGYRSSSDFEGKAVLKYGVVLAAIAAGSFVAGCLGEKKPDEKDYLFNGTKPKEPEPVPVQIVKPVHISEFAFGKEGEIGEMRNRFTNESYQIKFAGIERDYVPTGRWIDTIYEARLFITDLNTTETKSILLRDGLSVDIDGNLSAHIDVGRDYARLSIREE